MLGMIFLGWTTSGQRMVLDHSADIPVNFLNPVDQFRIFLQSEAFVNAGSRQMHSEFPRRKNKVIIRVATFNRLITAVDTRRVTCAAPALGRAKSCHSTRPVGQLRIRPNEPSAIRARFPRPAGGHNLNSKHGPF